jgi:hypothetical protein
VSARERSVAKRTFAAKDVADARIAIATAAVDAALNE